MRSTAAACSGRLAGASDKLRTASAPASSASMALMLVESWTVL